MWSAIQIVCLIGGVVALPNNHPQYHEAPYSDDSFRYSFKYGAQLPREDIIPIKKPLSANLPPRYEQVRLPVRYQFIRMPQPPVPPPRIISNDNGYQTILRHKLYQRVVSQPVNYRYMKKSFIPVVHKVDYDGRGVTDRPLLAEEVKKKPAAYSKPEEIPTFHNCFFKDQDTRNKYQLLTPALAEQPYIAKPNVKYTKDVGQQGNQANYKEDIHYPSKPYFKEKTEINHYEDFIQNLVRNQQKLPHPIQYAPYRDDEVEEDTNCQSKDKAAVVITEKPSKPEKVPVPISIVPRSLPNEHQNVQKSPEVGTQDKKETFREIPEEGNEEQQAEVGETDCPCCNGCGCQNEGEDLETGAVQSTNEPEIKANKEPAGRIDSQPHSWSSRYHRREQKEENSKQMHTKHYRDVYNQGNPNEEQPVISTEQQEEEEDNNCSCCCDCGCMNEEAPEDPQHDSYFITTETPAEDWQSSKENTNQLESKTPCPLEHTKEERRQREISSNEGADEEEESNCSTCCDCQSNPEEEIEPADELENGNSSKYIPIPDHESTETKNCGVSPEEKSNLEKSAEEEPYQFPLAKQPTWLRTEDSAEE